MKINTHNYEAYLLDFMEGNLCSSDEMDLREFVRLHPYLQIDLENLNDFILIPDKINFNKKHLLKEKPETAIDGLSKIERLSIAFLEKDIQQEEMNELNQLIENPKNKKVFNTIQRAKLNNPQVIYQNKPALKKKATIHIFSLKAKYLYRIAAFILLLLSLTFWLSQKQYSSKTVVELIAIKEIPLREINIFKENMEHLPLLGGISNYENNQPITDKESYNKKLEKELIFIKPKAVQTIISADMQNSAFSFAENIQKPSLQDDNLEKEKDLFTQKAVWAVKKSAKKLLYNFAYSLRKNIRYKKQYLEDGKVLIALKAGDFEYKRIKELKKP